MKITWLGQAGLLLESEGLKIVVDPYLSDSCRPLNPQVNVRRVEVDPKYLEMEYDVAVFTHDHMDHTDPDTCKVILTKENPMLVLAPEAAWQRARAFGGNNNYVKFNRHTSWTEGAVRFTAVKAEHSDVHPIGVIIEAEGKKLYITGDTLYNEEIFGDIPADIDLLFLPVNGVGNNMNPRDAKRFAERIGARATVPLHYGMFDDTKGEDLDLPRKRLLKIYQQEEV